jgi:hypothetical protein
VSIVTFPTLQLVFLNRSKSPCWGPRTRLVEETPQKDLSKNVMRPNSFEGTLTGTAVNDCGELCMLGKGHALTRPPIGPNSCSKHFEILVRLLPRWGVSHCCRVPRLDQRF